MGRRYLPSLPTRARDWRLMGRTARLVLTIPTYAAIGVLATLAGLTTFVVSQNFQLVLDVVVLGSLPLSNRVAVLVSLYPLAGTAFTPLQSAALLVTALFVGIDVAMVTYHVREHDLGGGGRSSGVVGVVLGTLGAGCAACGSALIAGVLSLVGAGSLLTLLPMDGLEFSILAVVVLVLSIYWLAEGLRGGQINGCPVEI